MASSAEPLHSQILEDIRGKIVGGQWKPGRQLDKETDLALQYGVSRMTMNKVLTRLAQDGYVIRRKRSGTFVAKARTQSAVMAISNIADEVAELGRAYSWQLLHREERHLAQADLRLLGVRRPAIEENALCLQGLHFADAEPFCLENRAINLSAVPQAQAMDFATVVPGIWLLDTMPWTTARHSIRAVNTSVAEAKLLQLPVGAACLEVLRKTEMQGAWVTFARLLYPGEAHQLTAEFELHGADKTPNR